MKFKVPKKYGQYKVSRCSFCGKVATCKNDQGAEVCPAHRKSVVEEIKCKCGSWLELNDGKFGPYFNCLNCGNINFAKGMEMKSLPINQNLQKESSLVKENKVKESTSVKKEIKPRMSGYPHNYQLEKESSKKKKEIVISSRDVDYFC